MKTNQIRDTGRVPGILARILVVAGLTLASPGCKGTDTVTGIQPRPTPTPAPLANIAGAWTGTYSYNVHSYCQNLPVVATFEQTMSDVTATFTHPRSIAYLCRFPISLSGRLDGNTLRATASGGWGWYPYDPGHAFTYTANAGGTVHSDATFSIFLSSEQPNTVAQMELHRR